MYKHLLKDPTETLYVASMGKRLRVTAIFTTDEAANAHMAQTDDACVAVFGPFILLANKYDKGAEASQ